MKTNMKTAATGLAAVAAIAASVALPTGSQAASGGQNIELGDLICDVGPSSKEPTISPLEVPSVKQELHCVIRNSQTGATETYRGNFKVVGSMTSVPHKSTLLWEVRVTPGTKMTAGVLEQSYEARPSKINQARVKVIGEAKPGVSLRLITDESKDKPALPVLSLQLNLISSSA
jgi:hypothetical protein